MLAVCWVLSELVAFDGFVLVFSSAVRCVLRVCMYGDSGSACAAPRSRSSTPAAASTPARYSCTARTACRSSGRSRRSRSARRRGAARSATARRSCAARRSFSRASAPAALARSPSSTEASCLSRTRPLTSVRRAAARVRSPSMHLCMIRSAFPGVFHCYIHLESLLHFSSSTPLVNALPFDPVALCPLCVTFLVYVVASCCPLVLFACSHAANARCRRGVVRGNRHVKRG